MDREASPEDTQKIIECLRAGRVKFAGDIDLLSQPDGPLVINDVRGWNAWRRELDGEPIGNDGGFEIAWSKPGIGFGQVSFAIKEGQWTCDDEHMGRAFVNEIIAILRAGEYGDEIAKKYIPEVLKVAETIKFRDYLRSDQ